MLAFAITSLNQRVQHPRFNPVLSFPCSGKDLNTLRISFNLIAERMQLYEQAQNILIEEVPVHPLLYHRGHLLLKPWIAEYPISPMRWDHWKDVVIEPHD
jgi:ABC-type transport system substrate-binding protein